MKYVVIWDWNGTLLNDVEICVRVANEMLERRGLPEMTVDRYRQMFTFPVQRYYESMGFDFLRESFADVAVEFHEAYRRFVRDAPLHHDVMEGLEYLREAGFTQVVLSALEEGRLHNELEIRGIGHFFAHAYGLSDLHARSKADRGLELLSALGTSVKRCWMIGDTDHDAEVASTLGVACVLVADGHHSRERLGSTGAMIVGSAGEAARAVVEASGTRTS